MRFVLTGGGTGGHVYPALSVGAELRRRLPASELLYIGTPRGAESRLVPQHGIAFRSVPAGQVRGKAPWQVAGSLLRLGRGVAAARAELARSRPAAVFATGGYASMPVAIAARLASIPLLVFLPDVVPGWAVRVAARLATRVATSTDEGLRHLPRAKSTVTGYPLRQDFGRADRAAARTRFQLEAGPVLLVSGASSGSRALNDAVFAALHGLLELCQVIHLTGDAEEVRALQARDSLPMPLRGRYHVYGYLDDMAGAMAAADLAVLRAGASCLAEPAIAALPAILVPGPFSDQHRNAAYMASHGAAVLLEQRLLLQQLLPLAQQLLGAPERLRAMADAARALARESAAEDLAALLIDIGSRAPLVEARVR